MESKSAPAIDDAEAASSVTEPLAVSVIIPVHNEVATIGTLVEKVGSVMQNRGGPYEVVCVDDGSTDGTHDLSMFFLSCDCALVVKFYCKFCEVKVFEFSD